MGLRFRKSVKLFPGVRLNVSAGGASVSVGRPGARLNFSARGIRATTGIPGTGISYSTQLTSGSAPTRRRSTQQLAAEYRRIASERKYEAAQAEAAEMEQELDELLNSWRAMPPLRSEEELRQALKPRAFQHEAPPPEPPDAAMERRTFVDRARADAGVAQPRPRHAARISAISGAAFFIACFPLSGVVAGPTLRGVGAASLALIAGLTVYATLVGRWSRGAHERTTATLARWPAHFSSLLHAFQEQSAAYQRSYDDAVRAWTGHEQERIGLLTRVLAGDQAAIHASGTNALETTDFPFETQCDIGLADASTAYVRLDLPEIEDVVPEFRLKPLKNGAVTEVKRKKQERCDAYAHLAAGLAIHIAGSVFSAAPTLRLVHVAGYTQRKQRGTDRIDDDYIYDVLVTRAFYSTIDPSTIDPMAALRQLDARYEQKKDGEFKKMSPPAWVTDAFGPEHF